MFFIFGAVYAHLLISEVSFIGTDEWIEIYNPDDQSFSGFLLLS